MKNANYYINKYNSLLTQSGIPDKEIKAVHIHLKNAMNHNKNLSKDLEKPLFEFMINHPSFGLKLMGLLNRELLEDIAKKFNGYLEKLPKQPYSEKSRDDVLNIKKGDWQKLREFVSFLQSGSNDNMMMMQSVNDIKKKLASIEKIHECQQKDQGRINW